MHQFKCKSTTHLILLLEHVDIEQAVAILCGSGLWHLLCYPQFLILHITTELVTESSKWKHCQQHHNIHTQQSAEHFLTWNASFFFSSCRCRSSRGCFNCSNLISTWVFFTWISSIFSGAVRCRYSACVSNSVTCFAFTAIWVSIIWRKSHNIVIFHEITYDSYNINIKGKSRKVKW